MKRYFISLVLLLSNMFPMIAVAYDRHGRDYSVRDGDGSSGLLIVLVIVGAIAYGYFCGGRNDL